MHWRGAIPGLLGGVERHLFDGLTLRFEGGPMTTALRAGKANLGVESDPGIKTPLSGWAALGMGWRL